MQMAFNAIKARMREVKIEEARREMEKLEADVSSGCEQWL